MARSKETLSPCVREVRFIRSEADEKGTSIVYYFQTTEFLSELNFILELDILFSNMTDNDLKNYKGNLKFKIPADYVNNPKFKSLIESEPGKNYVINYADSPQALDGDRGSVSWEKSAFLGLFKSWAEFYEKDLKAKNKVNFAATAAGAATRTPATSGTSTSPA
jgi:hypothetical protein